MSLQDSFVAWGGGGDLGPNVDTVIVDVWGEWSAPQETMDGMEWPSTAYSTGRRIDRYIPNLNDGRGCVFSW